jgi:DNA-binding NtrC family response regulator
MPRILIVDKDAQIRKLLQTILDYAGYEVLTAPDPQVAIEMCNSSEGFDVVLSGVSLPGMDGHDLARWIAAHCPNSRVILMSAVDSVCEVCPFAAGCGIMRKPFIPQAVVGKVAEALAQPPG